MFCMEVVQRQSLDDGERCAKFGQQSASGSRTDFQRMLSLWAGERRDGLGKDFISDFLGGMMSQFLQRGQLHFRIPQR